MAPSTQDQLLQVGRTATAPRRRRHRPGVRLVGLALLAGMLAAPLPGCYDGRHRGYWYPWQSINRQILVPAGLPGTPLLLVDEGTERLDHYGSSWLELVSAHVSGSRPLDFANRIEIEAKDFSFWQARWRTIARFEGVLQPGTHEVGLALRVRDLTYYIQPWSDRMELRVRIEGEEPDEDTLLLVTLRLESRYY